MDKDIDSDIPARVSQYRVLHKIGEGGMGVVYAAEDTRLGRKVAIKMIRESSDDTMRERLWREARSAASVNHPNVCHIYEVGQERDELFIAMEMLEGESLASRLARGPMTADEAITIAVTSLGALGALHRAGLVHRDLKPSNIFLTPHGVKLLDFGLAVDSERTGSYLTQTGAIVGTPAYMSPEQAAGDAVGPRSDLFAIGVILYEMLAGKHPFERPSTVDMMHAVMHDQPPQLSGTDTIVAAGNIILRALEKRPADRYPTADAMAEDLKGLLKNPASASSLAVPAGRISRFKRVAQLLLVLIVVAAAASIAYFNLHTGSREVHSIAVLPFVNSDDGQDLEYLTDGLTESLINDLARLPQLTVTARNTVFRYKKRQLDGQAVGKELGVETVVVGRVGRLGDVVVVDVELIDTGDGSQLWSAQYKEKASDILATQREITSRISGNLRPRLSGDQHRELVKRYTQDAEAYRLYLQGRFYLNKRTAESVKIALDLFQQAVQRDARYAPAHVGISDCYQSLIEYNALPIKEGFQHAKSAVLRALELDETLGEAHASLGFIRLLFDWDWSGAEQGFRRAIELNPEYAMAHQWYGVYNVARGKFDEGIAETRRAIDLEPSSTILNSQLARALYFAGRYDAAIEQARKTSVLDPAYPSPYVYSGQSHIQKGMYAEGIALLEHAQTIAPDRDEVVAALGHAYAAAGKRDRALAIIKRLTVAGPRQSDTSYRVAMIYAGLGEKELALSSLQEAYEESDASMSTRLKVDPVLAGLHKDPRFKELLRSIGN